MSRKNKDVYYEGNLLRPVIYKNKTFYWLANEFSKASIGKDSSHAYISLFVKNGATLFGHHSLKRLDYEGIAFANTQEDFKKEVTKVLKKMLEEYWSANFAKNTFSDPNFLNGPNKIVIDSDPEIHAIEKV